MSTVPFIPENAPFNPAQRAWLNGFLAGLYSSAPAQAASAAVAFEPRNVAVLYASQTGTGERLAKKVAKELKAKGHTAKLSSLDAYPVHELSVEECAVIVASTYGEGDPPDGVKGFFDALCADNAPRLERLEYSVLALGDSHYEHFCKFGVDLDKRLEALGAKRTVPIVIADVEVDEPFERWKSALLARLEATAEATPAQALAPPAPAAPASIYHRDNPFYAPLVDKRVLTAEVSSKSTLHLSFSLAGSDLVYETGDALAVVPSNDPMLVADILKATNFIGEELVEIPKVGTRTITEALSHVLQITRLSRKLVDVYAKAGDLAHLKGLLLPEQQTHLDTYLADRGLIDILLEHPGVIASAQQLADLLPKLAPRLYSISSSPRAHAGEVHATVAVVRYRAHNRERGGVCSTLFADRTDLNGTLPIYIQHNKKFRLPADSAAPIIMIGPGTGIAPFRGFLHERCAVEATGKNWLFFGDRSAATDFLYRDEFDQMLATGHLTRLDTAFSRDQAHKIYVQDRMLEHGAEFFGWLEEGAIVYVCGDASRMAKDVDAALHQLIAQHGAMEVTDAEVYVQNLHDTKRYHRDVY